MPILNSVIIEKKVLDAINANLNPHLPRYFGIEYLNLLIVINSDLGTFDVIKNRLGETPAGVPMHYFDTMMKNWESDFYNVERNSSYGS